MAQVISELVTKFSFVGSTKKLEGYNKSLGLAAKRLALAGTAVLGAATALSVLTIKTISQIDALNNLSNDTNVAVEDIQRLGFIATQTGSSMDALKSSLSGLTSKIGDAAQRGSEDFARLGISVRDANGQVKSADKILNEVALSFKRLNLSDAEKQNFASKLGIDKSVLNLMKLSTEELKAMGNEAEQFGIITTHQANKAALFNNSVEKLKFGLGALKNTIAISLGPTVNNLISSFNNFLKANKDLIANGLKALFKILSFIVKIITSVIKVVYEGTAAILQFKAGVVLVTGAVALLMASFAPITGIVLLITGIIAVIEDLYVGLTGGKSVIRDWLKSWFGFDISGLIDGITNSLQKTFDWVNNIIDSIASFFGFGSDKKAQVTQKIQNQNITPAGIPNQINNNQVRQDIKINIDGARDPEATASSVRDGLQDQLNNAQNQLAVGGI